MNVGTRGLTDEDEKVRQGAVMHVEEYDVEKPDPAYMTVDASGVPAAPYQVSSSVLFVRPLSQNIFHIVKIHEF